MGIFANIGGVFRSYGSVFMIIVLAVADHLWGENVFNCPCGRYRILYTSAFLVVPPVVIIIIDTSWRVLFLTCRQFCSRLQPGIWETMLRLISRPLIIGILWLIFSCMEPKFGRCIYKEVSCNCTEKELQRDDGCSLEMKQKTARIRVFMASVCLGLTCLSVLVGCVLVIYKACGHCLVPKCRHLCLRFNCCTCCVDACCSVEKYHGSDEDPAVLMELTQCLYTVGVEPKTVIRLQEEKLLAERRLTRLSEQSLCDLRAAIGLGQMEILKAHMKDVRLVKWLLRSGYSRRNALAIVEKCDYLSPVIDNMRKSLDCSGTVSTEDSSALEEELHRQEMGRLLPQQSILKGYNSSNQESLTASNAFVMVDKNVDDSELETDPLVVRESSRGYRHVGRQYSTFCEVGAIRQETEMTFFDTPSSPCIQDTSGARPTRTQSLA